MLPLAALSRFCPPYLFSIFVMFVALIDRVMSLELQPVQYAHYPAKDVVPVWPDLVGLSD